MKVACTVWVRGKVRDNIKYLPIDIKLLTQLCEDENMLESYRQGKDLYSQIAAIAFHTTYEKCLEHFPKNTPIVQRDGKWDYATEEEIQNKLYTKLADGATDTYKAGKSLRSQAKSILLGIMYGRGEKSIAEQLGCTIEEAKAIKDDVYNGFPAIKEFEDASNKMAIEKGYVTTLWGRKRRLPEMQLPPYEFKNEDGSEISPMDLPALKLKMAKVRSYREKLKVIDELRDKHIIVTDNGKKIADAQRQVINSRVQGCLDGNVSIITKQFGKIKIKTAVNSTLTIWDGNSWTPGTIVYSGKKQKCIIHFIGGQEFICSPDHKFDIIGDDNHYWIACKNLIAGMKITLNHKYEHCFGPVACIDHVDITNEFIDMYDVCNTDRGYFVADGLITHNSAADMSKKAMIAVSADQKLKELDGQIVIPVHDELILKAPLRNSRVVKDLFTYDMERAAEDKLTIPIKCDCTISFEWYGDELDLDKELKGLNDI